MNSALPALVRGLLTRPRPVPDATARHLATRLGCASDELPALIVDGLPELDEFEIEERFAAVVTPRLDEQIEVELHLEAGPPSPTELDELLAGLVDDPPQTPLDFDEGTRVLLPLNRWLIERFVRLLQLPQTLHPADRERLRSLLPETVFAETAARLRKTGLSGPATKTLFFEVLEAMRHAGAIEVRELRFVLDLIHRHRLGSAAELLACCSSLTSSHRRELMRLEGAENPVIPGWKQLPTAGVTGQLRRRDDEAIALRRKELLCLDNLAPTLTVLGKARRD